MSQWLQSAKATVSAGASVISFADNQDFSSVRAGDVVMLNGQIWQCASGTRPDSAGQSTVTLAAPWPYTGASNVNAFVFRTTHDLLQLTSDARKLTNITKALLAAQEDILKGTTPTINVPIGLDLATGNEEVIPVTPWQYVINTVNASLGNISAIGAMSQVQFEAIREQNKEKYAASGFVHFGKHENESQQVKIVNQGMNTYSSIAVYANSIGLGRGGDANSALMSGRSTSRLPVLNMAGCLFTLEMLNTASSGFEAAKIKFPQAPDGKTTYNKLTGVTTNHATVTAAFNAQAADPTNVEVVINRVDMWGFESWLEEVNTTNPYIYPNGLIQSQATTMDGIATSISNRPVTYYAVFDGDTGSKGKGINFFSLTDAQKKKILSNHKNNLHYLDDGRLVQWRLRVRSFAGAGNGDWLNVDSTKPDDLLFAAVAATKVKVQGVRNNPADTFFVGNVIDWNPKRDLLGLFTAISWQNQVDLESGINGECYFLVCGTVNRLNQGAYHPSFNPSGSGVPRHPSNAGISLKWYEVAISSTAQCFAFGVNPSDMVDGSMTNGSYWCGRPDGRYYDAIYASGQGGVCRDMRYSANKVGSVDFAEADQRVKNGTYRGFEKLVFSKAIQGTSGGESDVFGLYYNDHLPSIGTFAISQLSGVKNSPSVGDIQHIYESSTGLILSGVVTSTSATVINCRRLGADVAIRSYSQQSSANFIWISSVNQPMSVGGSFLQTDVIGNPANILATPALANGWQGSWVPNTGSTWVMSRKAVNSSGLQTYSSNNGATWGSAGLAINIVTNDTPAGADNLVWIAQYQAFAKQTESAVNTTVYGGVEGVKNVCTTAGFAYEYGAVWAESLFGKIPKGSANIVHNLMLESYGFFLDGRLLSDIDYPVAHSQISMATQNNLSPALKALNYNVNLNQQAFIQYAYTELKHNGTNWGDDGKVTIVDNQATKTDLNGNTVLVGTAKLKEPIGWIKNKV